MTPMFREQGEEFLEIFEKSGVICLLRISDPRAVNTATQGAHSTARSGGSFYV